MSEHGTVKVVRVRAYTGEITLERIWYVAIEDDDQAMKAVRSVADPDGTSEIAIVGELQPAMRAALAMQSGDIKPADASG